jgi:hypothetical protein
VTLRGEDDVGRSGWRPPYRHGLALTGRSPPREEVLYREMLAPAVGTAGDGRSVNAKHAPNSGCRRPSFPRPAHWICGTGGTFLPWASIVVSTWDSIHVESKCTQDNANRDVGLSQSNIVRGQTKPADDGRPPKNGYHEERKTIPKTQRLSLVAPIRALCG